jgi:hypothetical protein
VRIIVKARNKESCHPLFRQLNILPLYSQYIFSLLLFVVKNLDIFSFNSDVHSINTRQVSHLYLPGNKLAKVQKGVYYSGIKIFNMKNGVFWVTSQKTPLFIVTAMKTSNLTRYLITYHKASGICQVMLSTSNRL